MPNLNLNQMTYRRMKGHSSSLGNFFDDSGVTYNRDGTVCVVLTDKLNHQLEKLFQASDAENIDELLNRLLNAWERQQ